VLLANILVEEMMPDPMTIELHIGQFPPFANLDDDASLSEQVGDYLLSLLGGYPLAQGLVVVLPPLPAMGAFFKTSHLVVHDAFQVLRQHGLDYALTGWDGTIRFWKPTNLG